MDRIELIRQLYTKVYGTDVRAVQAFEELLGLTENAKSGRKEDLRRLDKTNTNGYFSQDSIGMTLYVDLFAGDLKKMIKKIDYFKELGVTYLHLMPLLKPRDGENDGGYAVEDYRRIDPRLGTMDDFIALLDALRKENIGVCIDYVVNHVAKEHVWAQAALAGDPEMQERFILFDTKEMPDRYNRTVPEVLPDKCPGNFTYYPEIKKYVFTSFSDFQWDLNFKNPLVFNGMIDNLLFLANLGITMIRLDAIPFMWKEVDTTCRNLPVIHDLMRLYHLIKQEVCPSVALLGEAIVEPQEIVKYFGTDAKPECEIMYNANLMVDIYHAFATRDTRLLTIDANRFHLPHRATWMNYARCHDDIGWGFNEDAIRKFGWDPYDHKQFLIHFYGGDYPGTFAMGEHYQFNPATMDARTNGTLASLLGLEKALKKKELYRQEEAIRRIHLTHAFILAYRGIPLIYSGDEIATLNDQRYLLDPAKAPEGRWVHRPFFDWKRAQKRNDVGTFEYRVFQQLKQLIKQRKALPYLHGQASQIAVDLGNPHVFGIVRTHNGKTFFALFNFSENTQIVSTEYLHPLLVGTRFVDVFQGREFDVDETKFDLSPYEFVWCIAKKEQ